MIRVVHATPAPYLSGCCFFPTDYFLILKRARTVDMLARLAPTTFQLSSSSPRQLCSPIGRVWSIIAPSFPIIQSAHPFLGVQGASVFGSVFHGTRHLSSPPLLLPSKRGSDCSQAACMPHPHSHPGIHDTHMPRQCSSGRRHRCLASGPPGCIDESAFSTRHWVGRDRKTRGR